MSRRKREQLFERGSTAFRTSFPELLEKKIPTWGRDAYVCPLCCHAYPRESLYSDPPRLTLEHVPPASQGGRSILLTCHQCNTRHGKFNRHALIRRRGESFYRAEMPEPLPAFLEHEGFTVAGDLQWSGDGLHFAADLKRTNPSDHEAFFAAFDQKRNEAGAAKFEFKARLRDTYRKRYDHASTLRDAYLLAFAALGYRYIFRTALDGVREQIMHPDEAESFRYRWRSPEPNPPTLILAREPVDAVVVVFGTEMILMPGRQPDTREFDSWLRSRKKLDQPTFTGAQVPWPTWLHAALDVGAPKVRP